MFCVKFVQASVTALGMLLPPSSVFYFRFSKIWASGNRKYFHKFQNIFENSNEIVLKRLQNVEFFAPAARIKFLNILHADLDGNLRIFLENEYFRISGK